jgi:GT2 family glycosyltransferase
VRAGAVTLSVSIVVYHPDVAALRITCRSLVESVMHAQHHGVLGNVSITIVDNAPADEPLDERVAIDRLLAEELGAHPGIGWSIVRGHGNVGYGRGHNRAIEHSTSTYHLILNPDVHISAAALLEGISFLERSTDVGLLTPDVRGPDGERQYLCRTRPSVLTLLVRGFGPAQLKRVFADRLARYELRDRPPTGVTRHIEIVSGCFMLTRRSVLAAIGGFHPGYFLYFEDYDLSLEMGKRADIAFVESVRIVHWGGGVPGKSLRHRLLYMRSALRFFQRQGWRLF